MRKRGMSWEGGLIEHYPRSFLLAWVYLSTWGYAAMAVGVGATRMMTQGTAW